MDDKRSLSCGYMDSSDIEMPNNVCMSLDNEFCSSEEEAKSSNMSVFARIRPMLQREEDAGYKECVAAIDDKTIRAVVPKSSMKFKNSNHADQEIIEDFTYTQAFGPEVGQFVFFEQTIMNTMKSFIDGQNCLIFSYGITNSGKTYTLQGDESNPGIIILALRLFFASIEHQIFDSLTVKPDKFSDVIVLSESERMKEIHFKDNLLNIYNKENSSRSMDSANQTKSFAMSLCDCFSDKYKPEASDTTLPPDEMEAAQCAALMKKLSKEVADQQVGKCNIWISFIEIYNEYIYDLLQCDILNRKKLQMAEDQSGDVYVKGVKEVFVSDVEEAIKLLHLGRRNLRIASTKLNYQSSRSHCIYMVKVVRISEDKSSARVNRLSFCDLAGSERAGKSHASGMRLKEAGYINSSLLVLGRCLEQLRLNQNLKDKKIVPFRESKLTRLFSGLFLGKGQAVMIANASPCEYTFDETLNVLRFSAVAKELILNDEYMKMASSSLMTIAAQLAQSNARASSFSLDCSSDLENSLMEDIQAKDEMIEKLLDLADSLRNNLEKEKKEKAELEIVIRHDVCKEYSEYSDELFERQKNNYEQQIQELRGRYEERISSLEKSKDDIIKDLKEQLAEYESSDDSFKTSDGDTFCESKDVIEPNTPVSKFLNHSSEHSDVFNLKNESNRVSRDMNTLLKELEKCVEENRTLKLDLCSLKNQSEMSVAEMEISNEKISSLQDEIKQYQEQCSSLKIDLDSMTATKNGFQIEIETLSADLNTIENNLNSVTSELAETKQKLEETLVLLNTSQSNESLLQEKSADLQFKLQEALEILSVYEKENNESKASVIASEVKCNEYKEEKQKLEDTVFSLSEEIASANDLVEKLKEEKQEVEEALGSLRSEKEDLESYKTLNEDLQKQLEVYEKLKIEYENLEKLKTDLSLKCGALEEENYRLSESSDDLSKGKEKLSELHKKLEEITQSMQEKELKIQSLEQENEDLKKEKSEFLKDGEKLHNINQNLQEITQSLVEEKVNVQSLELEKDDLIKEKENLVVICNNLEKQIDNHDAKFKELNLKMEETSQVVKDQRAKLFALESECEAYKNESSDLFAKCKSLEEEMASLSTNYENLKVEKENETKIKEEIINSLSEEKMETEDKVAELKTKLEEAGLKIEEQEKTYTLINEKYKNLEENNMTLEHEMEALTGKYEKTYEDEKEKLIEKHNATLLELETLKSKLSKLESDCADHLCKYNDLLENHENLNSEFEDVIKKLDDLAKEKENIGDLNKKLEEITQSLQDEKLKVQSLEQENENLKKEKDNLSANGDISSEEKLNILNKNLQEIMVSLEEEKVRVEALESEKEELMKEKQNLVVTYNKLEVEIDTEKMKSSNLENKMLEVENCLKQLKSDFEEKQAEYSTLEVTHQNLLTEKKEIEEKYNDLCGNNEKENDKLETMRLESENLQENVVKLEKDLVTMSEELNTEKMKSSNLENKILKSENSLKQLSDDLEKKQVEYSNLEANHQKNIIEKDELQEKYNNLFTNNEESNLKLETINLETKNLQKENKKLKQNIEKLEKDMETISEELNLATENVNKLKEEKELHLFCGEKDKLINALELCELKSAEKVKSLESLTKEYSNKIKDMHRQILEKETSISELEKALCDIQEKIKNVENKNKEKVFDLNQQHEVQIKEFMHLKQMTEKENIKLKSENEKLKMELDNIEIDTSKTSELEESKPKRTKRSALSNIEKSSDCKNSDSSESMKESEKNNKPRRTRRALRDRQPEANLDDSDLDEQSSKSLKRKSSDEFLPARKVQKKNSKPATKPATKKVTNEKVKKNVKANEENMSPAQKIVAAIRSVAQVMPSPRLTRGRKRLFNIEASSATKPWQY